MRVEDLRVRELLDVSDGNDVMPTLNGVPRKTASHLAHGVSERGTHQELWHTQRQSEAHIRSPWACTSALLGMRCLAAHQSRSTPSILAEIEFTGLMLCEVFAFSDINKVM